MSYFGAIRVATTIKKNSSLEIEEETVKLFKKVFQDNQLKNHELVSVILTLTKDITKLNPAKVLRERLSLNSVALICMQEAHIEGSLALCIRALIHVRFEKKREIKHIYREKARSLREDWL